MIGSRDETHVFEASADSGLHRLFGKLGNTWQASLQISEALVGHIAEQQKTKGIGENIMGVMAADLVWTAPNTHCIASLAKSE